jgi:hypothetical protein
MRDVGDTFHTALRKVFPYPPPQLILSIDSQFMSRKPLLRFGNGCMPSFARQGKVELTMI